SVLVLRPRTYVWVATIALYAATFTTLYLAPQHPAMHFVAGGAMLAALAAQMFALLRPNRVTEEPLVAASDGLRVGARTISRAAIENAYVQPATTGAPLAQKIYRERPSVVFKGKRRRDSISVLVKDE